MPASGCKKPKAAPAAARSDHVVSRRIISRGPTPFANSSAIGASCTTWFTTTCSSSVSTKTRVRNDVGDIVEVAREVTPHVMDEQEHDTRT